MGTCSSRTRAYSTADCSSARTRDCMFTKSAKHTHIHTQTQTSTHTHTLYIEKRSRMVCKTHTPMCEYMHASMHVRMYGFTCIVPREAFKSGGKLVLRNSTSNVTHVCIYILYILKPCNKGESCADRSNTMQLCIYVLSVQKPFYPGKSL